MTARSITLVLLAATALSQGGCAAFPRLATWMGGEPRGRPVEVRPVMVAQQSGFTRVDGYYASATTAISRRDYVRALDLLQQARAEKADDVRVLNAFGVVYDKLGRFDLSARYYGQARDAAPHSHIVARNLEYSHLMQTSAAAPVPPPSRPVVQAATTRTAPPHAVQVVRLGFAAPVSIQAAAGITGRPLEVADGSGRADTAPRIATALERRGWSSPNVVKAAEVRAETTITYAEAGLAAAQGLQRTLPGAVKLVRCDDGCQGVRLSLGRDASSWFAATAKGD